MQAGRQINLELAKRCGNREMNAELKVLFVVAEATPFSKAGGLADFAGSLPGELKKLGVDVRVMLPRHKSPSGQKPKVKMSFPVPVGSRDEQAHLLETESCQVPVYMVYHDRYFGHREHIYGFNDDPQRFVFFSRAVISAVSHMPWRPDVIHANDWHTCAVPTWVDIHGRDLDPFRQIATVMTIHSLAYQGICGRLILDFGRMGHIPHLDVEPPGKVNWLAQGIVHSDALSTVSPTYAEEITTPEVGGHLSGILHDRRDRLFGVLSGIDEDVWNPATDSALTQSFDVEALHMREVNKTALQRELQLSTDRDIPLLSMVTRLDPIKGLDLVVPALEALMQSTACQFILLGTGNEKYVQILQAFQKHHPRHVRFLNRFDERLARRIYGGADFFLMPSREESASTSVMIAMRYGAIPVVRSTGGLCDAVIDVARQPERGTGFRFDPFVPEALAEVLERAFSYQKTREWPVLQTRVMKRDFSWKMASQAYVDLYKRAKQLHASRMKA
jgi:starch synthase